MNRLRAISGDNATLRLIRASSMRGTVHSVFKHAVNLRRADSPEIVTLVSRNLADAPNTVVADVPDFAGAALRADLPVISDGGQVRIGTELVLDCAKAETWADPVLRYPADLAVLRRNMDHLCLECRVIPAQEAAGHEPLSVFAREASSMLRRATAQMALALHGRDEETAMCEARNILGLGLGFTPSGDDIMLGFLASLNITGAPGLVFGNFSRAVAEEARGATNPVSATSVALASAGRVNAVIAGFLHALMYLEAPAPQLALRKVLALGSSSGSDIAYGLMKGMEMNLAMFYPPANAGQFNYTFQEDSYVR